MTHTLTGTVHQLVSGEEGFEYENECNTPRSINGFRKKKKNHNNMACGHCWECGLHNRIFLTTAQDFQRDPSIIHPLEISHLSTRMQANPLTHFYNQYKYKIIIYTSAHTPGVRPVAS